MHGEGQVKYVWILDLFWSNFFFFSDDPVKRAKAFQKVLINIGKSQFVF